MEEIKICPVVDHEIDILLRIPRMVFQTPYVFKEKICKTNSTLVCSTIPTDRTRVTLHI